MIYGTNNSANGLHIQTFTNADNYPLLQVLSLEHNNVLIAIMMELHIDRVIQEVILF